MTKPRGSVFAFALAATTGALSGGLEAGTPGVGAPANVTLGRENSSQGAKGPSLAKNLIERTGYSNSCHGYGGHRESGSKKKNPGKKASTKKKKQPDAATTTPAVQSTAPAQSQPVAEPVQQNAQPAATPAPDTTAPNTTGQTTPPGQTTPTNPQPGAQ